MFISVLSKIMYTNIVFEEGTYVFTHKNDDGVIITDGKNLEELYANVKEAMDLHYQGKKYSLNIETPIHLSVTSNGYAVDV